VAITGTPAALSWSAEPPAVLPDTSTGFGDGVSVLRSASRTRARLTRRFKVVLPRLTAPPIAAGITPLAARAGLGRVLGSPLGAAAKPLGAKAAPVIVHAALGAQRLGAALTVQALRPRVVDVDLSDFLEMLEAA